MLTLTKKDGGDVVTSGVVKIIEVVGISEKSFDDAVQQAVAGATKSLRHVTGIDVKRMTAVVREGRIAQYHVDAKIAFAVEDD
ncbi:MAG TPA: dodecin family protein [Candidatus Limnocylindrales bacterium]|nr:dodecin family protein [Candidatus Limnocylindrales bacterium]